MKKQLALAVALAAASFAVSADELSYNYIEAGYVRTDIDNLGDGDGYGVNGSAALGEVIHLFGGYSAQEGSENGVEVDLDQLRVGLGVNYAISERADLLARFAYERGETDISVANLGTVSGEADGYSLELGVRGALASNFEGWVLAGYADLDQAEFEGVVLDTDEDEEDEVYGRIGAQFKFTPTWGVVAEGLIASDTNSVFVGLRASF